MFRLIRAFGKIYKESSKPHSHPHSLHAISVFIDASLHSGTNDVGLGFLIISYTSMILLAGSKGAVRPSLVFA